MKFYESQRWKRKRAAILRRDKYQCQESKRYGRIIQADTVHHIFPREHYPEYEWCDWNLISLAGPVHNEMHDRTTHELTPKGMALLRRTAKRRGITLPN